MTKNTVFDDILGIKQRKLASDMDDSITATVVDVSKENGQYGPYLKLDLQNDDCMTSINYRIPKALTGTGQMDRLLASLKKLDVPLEDIVGQTFAWQRQELTGPFKGNARHYPVRLVST